MRTVRWRSWPTKKNLRVLRRAGVAAGRGGVPPDLAAACWCRPRTASTPPATTRRSGGSRPASRPRPSVLADLVFAWRAVRSVKSNAILLARGGAAVGVGMGQVNRVDSARLAVARAGDRAAGSVAASDAFFPFADGLQVLHRRRRARRRRSRAARSATRRSSPPRRRPASPSTSPAPATSSTDSGSFRDHAWTTWKDRRMAAIMLDGRATLAAIKDELRVRVAALTAAGRPRVWARSWSATTRLARRTSRGKHRDCAEVGHRLDPRRPAGDRDPGRGRGRGRRAQRRPGLHRLPRPAAAAEGAGRAARCWSGSTRPRTPTACTR